jgi:hypothetical protein
MVSAMAHGVSYQFLIAQAWVQSCASPSGIYGLESGHCTGFCPSSLRCSLVSIIPQVFRHDLSVTEALGPQQSIELLNNAFKSDNRCWARVVQES